MNFYQVLKFHSHIPCNNTVVLRVFVIFAGIISRISTDILSRFYKLQSILGYWAISTLFLIIFPFKIFTGIKFRGYRGYFFHKTNNPIEIHTPGKLIPFKVHGPFSVFLIFFCFRTPAYYTPPPRELGTEEQHKFLQIKYFNLFTFFSLFIIIRKFGNYGRRTAMRLPCLCLKT